MAQTSDSGIDRDLEIISRQEQRLQFLEFHPDAAWHLGSSIRAEAVHRAYPVVIDIRFFSHPLFSTSLAGATPDNLDWVRRKSNVVARFLKSSYAVGLSLKRDSTTLLDRFALPWADYAAHGGSFPLTVRNAGVIGSITVSGLPQRDDHSFVVEMLCRELGCDYSELQLPNPPLTAA